MSAWGWGLLTYGAWTMGLGALLYCTGDPQDFDPIFRDKYTAHLGLVVTHGVSSVLALVIGPAQFLGGLRRERPRLHRWLGSLYCLSVVVGGLTALPMASMAEGGTLSRLGFWLSGLLWLLTLSLAVSTARRRNFRAHRMWMIRCYALTFGAVLLRLFLVGFQELGYDFHQIYPYTPWLSWTTSLLAAEFLEGGRFHVLLHPVSPPGRQLRAMPALRVDRGRLGR